MTSSLIRDVTNQTWLDWLASVCVDLGAHVFEMGKACEHRAKACLGYSEWRTWEIT